MQVQMGHRGGGGGRIIGERMEAEVNSDWRRVNGLENSMAVFWVLFLKFTCGLTGNGGGPKSEMSV